MVTIGPNEPLVKLTRLGDDVSPHSAYLTKESTVNEALASGRSLHDYFGLPARSEAPRYRMDEFRPLAPTEVFISRVAPTSELGGQITRSGGGEQYLAPNRTLFAASTHLRNIDNTLNLAAEVERGGLSPNLIRGAGALAAATVVYEATTTTVRSVDLLRQGNVTGAHSRIEHFASSTVGGLGQGAVGAEIGSFGGPVGTVVGGAMGYGLGAFGGEKLMDAYDNHKIYNQTDAQGQTWSYDPKQPQQGWTSDIPPLPGTPQDQHFTADPALANRLTYQANNTAVELAMAHPAEPRDPYTQPAAAHDTPSRIAAPWNRDAQTQAWSRYVTDQVLEHGPASTHMETATPERAAQLNAAAQQTIAENVAGSKRGIAEHYQAAYERRGWAQQGPMPQDVTAELRKPTNTLHASDGHTYTRAADGQWNTPGTLYGTNAAEGNLRAELDATRHQQRALHGESSQADRTQEAQRQQQIQGHIATREAPLPPTPGAILPGLRVPEREPAPAPSPGSYNHDAQTSAPTRTEPAMATVEPSHAALAAQQTHQQAMHAQQQARPQEERAASPSRDTTSLEPGRVAEAAALAPAAVSSPREVAPVLTPPLDPPALRDFRHAEHPLNPRYQMFRDALGEQGFHQDRPTLNEVPEVRGYSAEQKDRLAAGFTAKLGSDLLYNTEIQHFRKDGEALLAIEHPRDLGDRLLVLAVPEAQTLAHTPEQHAAAWRTRELPPPEAVNTQRPDPHSLSPDHPGHPDHSHHPLFEHARAALTHEYARWGMQKGAESLDRETVQVMIGARDMQMNDVGAVRLLKNGPEGRIGENPHLAVFATPEGPYQRFQDKAIVLGQTLQEAPSVAQSAVQFKEVDQAMTQQQLTNQALQAQIHAQGQQGQQGPMLGVGR
ncbi:hypothetical protein ACPPVV_11655 [Rhodanobacter sp. Col0626]|uniref:hypothetical protein n=1 Tax=Rhodanobacter sp. Col0626 TaxID=3415679 RepID=UPI003CF91C7D